MTLLKNNGLLFLFLAGTLLLALSCQNDKEEQIVAVAYNYKLLAEDLAQEMPDVLHGRDSVIFVQNYINRWMQEKVLLYQSAQNLGEDEMNIEKKIEKYRNSLLIFNYQKKFVQQNLDTIVSEQEISEYYQSHLNDFELKDNIVKVMFIKFENDSRNIKEAKNILKNYSPEDKEKLVDLSNRYAINYFLEDEMWLLFDDLLKEVPLKTYNQEVFLKNNKFVEIQDSLYTTLVLFNGFRIKESVSPLSFEYDRIKSIILNKRKQLLIRQLEEDIMEKARNDGALKTFN
ncbi:MAG: hypothetical protein JXR34_03730 [Bacteroidales bacterium]|nr:hypothetical protein [Bacteroidales bacterium]